VTSLGSTLVLKVLGERPISAPQFGVYSHRFGDLWLVGGASNSGGAVLRRFFEDEQLRGLSAGMDPERETGLDYYPLPAAGERFPVNDPALAPRLSPRPADDRVFVQGLLEGIARIEAQGYGLLRDLGAPQVRRVLTVGGGASNPVWTRIRQRLLGVPVVPAAHQEAAFGAARLALWGPPPASPGPV
jgi:sugar (pentulose or hexulose) kinase